MEPTAFPDNPTPPQTSPLVPHVDPETIASIFAAYDLTEDDARDVRQHLALMDLRVAQAHAAADIATLTAWWDLTDDAPPAPAP